MSFGNATLIIMDKNEVALAHWSLAATQRLNPDDYPAIYCPGPDAPERLEVSDSDMIAAIERVQKAITGGTAHPGRLRRAVVLAFFAASALAAVLWLPSALSSYAARILPETTRAAIGRDLAAEMSRIAGTPCQTPAGTRALRILGARLFPGEDVAFEVYRAGISDVVYVPGDFALIGRSLVENYDTPFVISGYLIAARTEALDGDPVADLLDHVGPLASIKLITTGRLPESAVDLYAEHLLKSQAPPIVDPTALKRAMDEASIPVGPYSLARQGDGSSMEILSGDTSSESAPRETLLSDSNWIALKQICEG